MGKTYWTLEMTASQSRSTITFEDDISYDHDIICDINPDHNRMSKWPIYSKALITRKPFCLEDILWGSYSTILFQEKAVKAFTQAGITGIKFTPIQARLTKYKGPEKLPNLYRIKVTGWGGICPKSSGSKLLEKCKCGMMKFAVVDKPQNLFNESEWDGSDIFRVWPDGRIIMTQKVYEIVNEGKLKGFNLIDIKDDLPNEYMKTFHRGSLLEFYDDEQAKRIGEPLGIY